MDRTSHHKKAFLAAYSEHANVSRAAEQSEIDRRQHYRWLKEDSEYAAAFDDAHQHACDRLEEEARRRAVTGVDEPVFYKGEVCGTIRKYSDTLLIFMMKGAMPDKYRDSVALTDKNGGPVVFKLERL